ncbi:hypothetical protein LZ31DRAFT_158172 [Colletotrichum somersetense]|nr:hypothetical protein LZ31DRAFT_158172 [Colletotrichum somersetense]
MLTPEEEPSLPPLPPLPTNNNKSSERSGNKASRRKPTFSFPRRWFSGKILRCHPKQRRGAGGSIPPRRTSLCLFSFVLFVDRVRVGRGWFLRLVSSVFCTYACAMLRVGIRLGSARSLVCSSWGERKWRVCGVYVLIFDVI